MSDTDPNHSEPDLVDLSEPPVNDDVDDGAVTASSARSQSQRVERLEAGADELRDRPDSFLQRTGLLVVVSAILVTLGLSIVVIGWAGASGSIHVEEQVPYLISGGILGGTIAVIGAMCLVTHWLTVSIREERARDQRAERRHAELLAALGEYRRDAPTFVIGEEANNHVDADGERPQRPLRASPRRP